VVGDEQKMSDKLNLSDNMSDKMSDKVSVPPREADTMKRENLAVRIWDVLYPLLMYYAVIVIVMFLAQLVLGTDSKTYMLRQIIATLVALPVVYALFYKPDVLLVQESRAALCRPGKGISAARIVLVAALLGISLNNILSMSPLVGMSEGFAQATEDFYAGTFALELIGSAFLTPVLEEMVYRGIVYTRLKRHLGVTPAVVLSAFVFGLMHFNIVQFLYAFVLGLMLALIMEKYSHVCAPILAHMTVNLISVVRTETGILDGTVDGSAAAWVISVVLFLIGAVLLVYWFAKPVFTHNSDTIQK
jgi:membrane protease YdiL (CAAX protease family)